jgi:hypothetical protein
MSRFPIDVVEFVEARFDPNDYAQVFKLLAVDAFSTPRVMRAAVFLADGDLPLLKHYAKSCATDPADVLVRAEFVIGATKEPLCAADFSELYLPGHVPNKLQREAGASPPLAAKPRIRQADHHAHLRDQEFELGKATYVVAGHQPHPQYVHCFRKEGQDSRVVRLPYVFVMDRLAERIVLQSADIREF